MYRRNAWSSIAALLLCTGAPAATAADPGSSTTQRFELSLDTRTVTKVAANRGVAVAGRAGPSISEGGTRVAFASTHDLLRDGSNADQNLEIFLLDTSTGELTQVTSSKGGEGSVAPQLNAAGTRIVFASDRDLLGNGSNVDDEVQLFLYDTLTRAIAQLTHAEGGLASFASGVELSLDDAGVRVAFASDRDLLEQGRNADENLEIFLLDTTTRGLEQLTETSGGKGCFAPTFVGKNRLRWTSDRGLAVAKKTEAR